MQSIGSLLAGCPMAGAVAALALGIAAGRVGEEFSPWLISAAGMLSLLVILAIYVRRRFLHGSRRLMHVYAHRNSLWLVVLPLFFALGVLLIGRAAPPSDSVISSGTMSATVLDKVTGTASERLTVMVDACGAPGGKIKAVTPFKARLYVRDMEVHEGDRVIFNAALEPIQGSVEHQLRDDAGFLYASGIDAEGRVEPRRLRVIGSSSDWRFAASRLRDKLVALIETSGLERPTVEFLNAILLGDTEGLDSDRRDEFAAAGIAHVLALSGLHVGIVLGLLGLLLLPLDMVRARTLRFLLMGIGILGFAWLTGMGASITRAAVMGAVLMGSRVLQRPHTAINALCMAAFLILFFDPRAIFHCGFQLSFLCTLAIMTCLVMGRGWVKALETALVIFLVSWPLMAWHFHSLSLLFLPLNLLALPLLPPFVSLAILYMLLQSVGIAPLLLARCVDGMYSLLEQGASLVAGLPGAHISLYPHMFVPVLCVPAALSVFYFIRSRSRGALALASVCNAAMLMALLILPAHEPLQAVRVASVPASGGVSRYRQGEVSTLIPYDSKITVMRWEGASVLYVDATPPPSVPLPAAELLIVGSHCRLEPAELFARSGRSRVLLSGMMRRKKAAAFLRYAADHDLFVHYLAVSPYLLPLK